MLMMVIVPPAIMMMVVMVVAGEFDPALIGARGTLLIECAQEFAGLVDRLQQLGIGVGTEHVEGRGYRHGLA